MNRLLSADLWPTLAKLSKKHNRLLAAISYVTTSNYLNFSENDLLVCDASDYAIKTGITSALALRQFFRSGAQIYSFEGLHAKTLIIDNKAVIGSANLSENAGVNTCEAAFLSDDPQVVALVRGFIEQLRKIAKSVDQPFLTHIESILVIRHGKITKRIPRRIIAGTSRLWLVSTQPLSEEIVHAEADKEQLGLAVAKKKLRHGDYEVNWIRYSGTSQFRREAKPGDLIIEVYQEKPGNGTTTEVYQAKPILHRQDEQGWTRFYYETPIKQNVYYRWIQIKSELLRLGFKKLSPKSTRELTKHATQVLACFE